MERSLRSGNGWGYAAGNFFGFCLGLSTTRIAVHRQIYKVKREQRGGSRAVLLFAAWVSITTIAPLSTCSLFQSMRPSRGATTGGGPPPGPPWYFNPRAPCGARQYRRTLYRHSWSISIHAPLAGCDCARPADADAHPVYSIIPDR